MADNPAPPEPFNFFFVVDNTVIEYIESLRDRSKRFAKASDFVNIQSTVQENLSIVQYITLVRDNAYAAALVPSLEVIPTANGFVKELAKTAKNKAKADKLYNQIKGMFEEAFSTETPSIDKRKSRPKSSRHSLVRVKLNHFKLQSNIFKTFTKLVDEWAKLKVKVMNQQLKTLNEMIPNESQHKGGEKLPRKGFCSFEDRMGIVDVVARTIPTKDMQGLLCFATKHLVDNPSSIVDLMNAIRVSCSAAEFRKTRQTIKSSTGEAMWAMLQNMDVSLASNAEDPVKHTLAAHTFDSDDASTALNSLRSSARTSTRTVDSKFIGRPNRSVSLSDIMELSPLLPQRSFRERRKSIS